MQSEFKGRTLGEVFRDLCLHERSGVLTVQCDGVTHRVYFDCGLILGADSTEPAGNLGQSLVATGVLSEGALAEAQGALTTPGSTIELARTLVHRDLLGKAAVSRVLAGILTRVIESAFRAERGLASFREAPPAGALFDADVVSTIQSILHGISVMSGFREIQTAMLGLTEPRLRMRHPAPVSIEHLPLSALQGFILSRVDGRTRFADLLAILPPEEEEMAARFVFGLLVIGVLEFDPPVGSSPFRTADILSGHEERQGLEVTQEQTIRQLYERVRERNPLVLLGVGPAAAPAEVELAYAKLKAQLNREALLPHVREKFREELAIIESCLVEALLGLTQRRAETHGAETPSPTEEKVSVQDLRVRMELDKATSRIQIEESNRIADSYYAKGRKCVREGDYHNAIQYGKLAVSHNPSDARYYRLLADCQARNHEARWQRMAEENYQRATQLDPWNPEYWMCLGRLYKRRGLVIRARRQFEEALKLGPNRREVLEELAALG